MTLKNNSLGDRLNEFKNKQFSEDTPNTILDLFNSVLVLVILFIKSFVFGYSLKLIFNTDWNFFSFLCIGLGLNFTFQFIYSLFQKE